MSHSQRSERARYDDNDGEEYETITFTQIDLPSTRLQLNPHHYLYRVKRGEMKKVMAQHIKIGDLVYVMRDGETATEAVLDTKTVYKAIEGESQILDGVIIVNNVLVSYKN
ncbi:hypothetical protein LOTGIDRAFT_155743 [Lottia gigantea]|uniref:Hint domain-containing protein n=1 Tax=Lottia gigantea TaxID=225164 RepID=V3ZPE8_LOTGI|nr:hypothetical protein LOTGIDRAFT_155743 [Lottia gigantea]ESO82726.1 hypothetical protein LOTGIDRAFT_155743 [Lottia gigantea]